jgi:DNA-binding response OmpR family regulator
MTQPSEHILIVDDERNIRKNLSMMLEAEGFAVDVASDGESALAKARECHYAIAFVDLHMPRMGGLDLTRSLRAFSSETAIVILTAYGSVQHAVAAMKLGAVDFLEKPFDPRTIRLLVEEILLRQRLESGGSVDELLHLATLARERNAYIEARTYLKSAILRDATRAEPFYWLGYLCEEEGDLRQAAHYYYLAYEVDHSCQLALDGLLRLGHLPEQL